MQLPGDLFAVSGLKQRHSFTVWYRERSLLCAMRLANLFLVCPSSILLEDALPPGGGSVYLHNRSRLRFRGWEIGPLCSLCRQN